MTSFRSSKHEVLSINQTKKSLSPFDDKWFILEDGYTTRAHGHFRNQIERSLPCSKKQDPLDRLIESTTD